MSTTIFKRTKVRNRVSVWVRELRKSMKMTQAEFADALDVSHITITNIENGRTIPTATFARNMCYLFNTDPDKWLQDLK